MKKFQETYKELLEYTPQNEEEVADKELIIDYLEHYGKKAFLRSSLPAHFTSSALVVNQTADKVLLAYHLIYQSYGWLGGHADGDFDLEYVARKELMEESGLNRFQLKYCGIASIEVIHVDRHFKKGKRISDHLHLNVSYLFEASDDDDIRIKEDENSSICWVKISDMDKIIEEKRMISIYQKILGRIK
ncbi:MAG: NUDIX domain-containing protein [Prevotella sp.]|nr:NUDIX domain-containing protein [Staphylococcus sp.]MCM1350502.1 NUDIX domain-containing protein [Prevotella sp.]